MKSSSLDTKPSSAIQEEQSLSWLGAGTLYFKNLFFPKMTLEQILSETHAYFIDSSLSADDLARSIQKFILDVSCYADIDQFLKVISSHMRQAKYGDSLQSSQYSLLKEALQNSEDLSKKVNWKDILFQVESLETEQNSYKITVKETRAYNQPTSFDNISHATPPIHKDEASSYGMIGNNFSTNKTYKLKNISHANEKTLVMDAFTCAHIKNNQGQDIILVALADGAGGHYGDERQDQAILRTSHFATKHAVRLMAAYRNNPEALDNRKESHDWLHVLNSVAEEIKRKNPSYGESCTLVCYAIFPLEQGYQLYGANIGDGMVGVWNGSERRLETISPGKNKDGWGPALLPSYKKGDVCYFHRECKEEDFVFALSDGVYNGLPITIKHEEHEQDRYKNAMLSESNEWIDTLPTPPSAKLLATAFMEKTLHDTNKSCHEKEQAEEEYETGDDLGLTVRNIPHLNRQKEKLEQGTHKTWCEKIENNQGRGFSFF